ncbi:MAG: PKD domain-containing protein, partial [Gammaproteobacteria bacterium]|nr:PKD domain-containing protein [Gammaproteobacteria bacterium]
MKSTHTRGTRYLSVLFLLITFLSACGGGSGGGDGDKNQAPTANAGDDQTVTELTEVTLDGSQSSDSDGSIAKFQWEQTEGPAAQLSDTAAEKPTFTAPDVTGTQSLVFRLTVTDDGKKDASDTVTITVNDRDSTPNAFTIPERKGVSLDTDVVSDIITVSGINIPSPISIEDGEYCIIPEDGTVADCETNNLFTAAAGEVEEGDKVVVRQRSADYFVETREATLTIGGVNGAFSAETNSLLIAPTSLVLDTDNNRLIGLEYYNAVVSGVFGIFSIDLTTGNRVLVRGYDGLQTIGGEGNLSVFVPVDLALDDTRNRVLIL